MRILSSTFGAVSSAFEALDSVAEIAKKSATKALTALDSENSADRVVAQKVLSNKLNTKLNEISAEATRVAEERAKLMQNEFYKQGQIDLRKAELSILTYKELTDKERIELLKKELQELENPVIASSVAEVQMTK